jgi:hypothetical protein
VRRDWLALRQKFKLRHSHLAAVNDRLDRANVCRGAGWILNGICSIGAGRRRRFPAWRRIADHADEVSKLSLPRTRQMYSSTAGLLARTAMAAKP